MSTSSPEVEYEVRPDIASKQGGIARCSSGRRIDRYRTSSLKRQVQRFARLCQSKVMGTSS